jgi:F-type H+-transporting ATPase subunit epsilon
MSKLQSIVVTPESTFRDGEADFVALNLTDGEIGIAPGHSPLIGRLGNGAMRITVDGKVETYYVEGGFVEVLDNVVTVLTGRVIESSQIDLTAAQSELDQARAMPSETVDKIVVREKAVDQARAKVRVAAK